MLSSSAFLARSGGALAAFAVGRKSATTNRTFTRRRLPSTFRISRAMASGAEPEAIVVYVTVPNSQDGADMASKIVSNKLAACVNQIPGVQSTYFWEGKVQTDSEVLLIIKTRKSLLQELTEFVTKEHSYAVPEVIALPIQGGNPAYLKWLEDSTKVA